VRQGVLLGLVAATAFAAVGVAFLPASLVTDRLPPPLVADGVSGTLWSGGVDTLRLDGAPLGALGWQLHPLALLALRVDADLDLARADGFARGRVAAASAALVSARDVEFRLPLAALAGLSAVAGWQGELAGQLPALRLADGWPVAVAGTLTVRNLRTPGSDLSLGDYAIEFDPPPPGGGVAAHVHDTGGPLVVRATLAFGPGRAYRLAGEVTPRPDAAPGILQTLGFLGAPGADGRRPFLLTGSY
jgi:hypothetical protein